MIDLDRLLFSQVRDAYPERWDKARPGNAFVNPHNEIPGRYKVRRQGGDWHDCVLVVAQEQFWGTCECQGYQMHDGPCSHLCAIFRLHADDADHWHRASVESIAVELRSNESRQADLAAEPDARAAFDGGRRQ